MAKKIKSMHVIKQKDLIETAQNPFENITEANIDTDNNTIQGCCLFGRAESINNRIYQDKAIESIARLSEGVKCFANHPSKTEIKESDGVRKIQDWVGVYRNARRDGEKVFADLECRESYFDMMKDIALMQPADVGNSINARVEVFQNEKGMESVVDVNSLRSVDIVSSAATTISLFEAVKEENKNEELDILLETTESRVKDKFKILMVEEGIIQDQLDNEKIQDEIRDVTWIANRLLDKTIHDSDLNITDKKSKIIEIFDDLESEIRKRLSGIKESLNESKENKQMDLQTLKTEHPELVKVILKEAQKADNVVKLEADLDKFKTDLQEASDKVDKLTQTNKDQAKDLNKKIEDLGKELTEAKDKNSEIEKELDEIKVAEAFADKKAKINKQISESKLPKDAITDVWVNDLMKLEDIEEGATVEGQVKERITDRITLINKKSGEIKGSGEEFKQDLEEGNKNKKSTEDAGKDFLADSQY
ncbi:hypothetical protein LCGC14_0570310 [marine sediment metagenome]|uniref:Uncharacterized protein n=1 Tax=marine sediment metagenome TaxID=412755 RepID=A0A0F9RPH3_9ZZZZ|nr:hypothetical protein [Pricia sp.]